MFRLNYKFGDYRLDITFQDIANLLNKPNLPTFADNAAALAGGLEVGTEYMKPTGERMIVVAGS